MTILQSNIHLQFNICHVSESMKGRANKQTDRWVPIVNCREFVNPKKKKLTSQIGNSPLRQKTS